MQERDVYFDNAKAVLIFFVVFGHGLEYLLYSGYPLRRKYIGGYIPFTCLHLFLFQAIFQRDIKKKATLRSYLYILLYLVGYFQWHTEY